MYAFHIYTCVYIQLYKNTCIYVKKKLNANNRRQWKVFVVIVTPTRAHKKCLCVRKARGEDGERESAAGRAVKAELSRHVAEC